MLVTATVPVCPDEKTKAQKKPYLYALLPVCDRRVSKKMCSAFGGAWWKKCFGFDYTQASEI